MSETQDSPSSFRGVAIGCLGFLGGGFLLFVFFIDLMVGGAQLSRTGFYLAFGFIPHCQRLSLSPLLIVLLIAGVVLAGVLIHFGLPRLLRRRQNDLTWSLGRSLGFLLLVCGLVLAAGGGAFALKHLPSQGDLVTAVRQDDFNDHVGNARYMIETHRKNRTLPADGLATGDPLLQELLTGFLVDSSEAFEYRFRLVPSGHFDALLIRIRGKEVIGGWEFSLVTGEMKQIKTLVWPGDAR